MSADLAAIIQRLAALALRIEAFRTEVQAAAQDTASSEHHAARS